MGEDPGDYKDEGEEVEICHFVGIWSNMAICYTLVIIIIIFVSSILLP